MPFNFERFTAAGKRFTPSISVRANGALGISQGALHQAGMTEGTWYVVLFYDREQKALAVKPVAERDKDSEEGAIKVSARSLNSNTKDPALSAFVAAKSFFNYYGIPHARTTSYKAVWDEKEKMLIAVLCNPELDESSSTTTQDDVSTTTQAPRPSTLSTPDKNEPTTME
jgi:hypothetical protein